MKRKVLLNSVGLFMVAISVTGCGNKADKISNSPNTKMDTTFYNPLDITKGVGDPWLYKHTDGYYYYTHSSSGVVKVTKTKSPTFLTENDADETRTKVLFRQKSINVVEIWAPEVFFFNGKWYCYFTAATDSSDALEKDGSRRIYGMVSKTDDIFGEWETAVKLALPNEYRAIDATFFNYNGHSYVVYSGWPQTYNQMYRQNLYINELDPNDPLKVLPTETERHLISEPTNTWERDGSTAQNEGPCVTFAPDGTPILMYSGSYSGGDTYCICYLKYIGGDILNISSWEKCSKPLMERDMAYSEIIAPGHNSVIKSPDGKEDWICYHSAKLSGSGWDRQVRLQKMTWDGNTPVVEKIYKASDEAPLPSGDKVNRFKFEAEKATLTDDCYTIDQDGYASNNKSVSVSQDGKITFEVMVPENGQYAIGIRYSNRDSSQTKINATINNQLTEVFAPNTMYDDSFFVSWFFTDLFIKQQGQNIIEINADPSILIDCIVLDYLDHTK